MIEELSQADLRDYEAIKKHVPEATPKQVKWIKELLNMARRVGAWEPVGETILSLIEGIDHHRLKVQALAGFKSAYALQLKERTKPTCYEQNGQLGLFHPEAFDGGSNQTLRQM